MGDFKYLQELRFSHNFKSKRLIVITVLGGVEMDGLVSQTPVYYLN